MSAIARLFNSTALKRHLFWKPFALLAFVFALVAVGAELLHAAVYEKLTRAFYQNQQIAHTLLLIGDAGKEGADIGRRNLKTLSEHISLNSKQTTVVFLGDNVYDAGIPDPQHPRFLKARENLFALIDSVRGRGSRVVFIPGNHDWDKTRKDGFASIKRQYEMVTAELGPGSFLPPNGCPGPESIVIKEASIKLIILDTQWWLHLYDKPQTAASGCATYSKEMVINKLKQEIETDPMYRKIFVTHHPFKSYGTHARKPKWIDHIFPIKEFPIPLPGIGSYVLKLEKHFCSQNLSCRSYDKMKQDISKIFRNNVPFLCASGHDHSLQLIGGKTFCKHYVISGAGSSGKRVKKGKNLQFGHNGLGFVRLDFFSDASVRYQAIGPRNDSALGEILHTTSLD